MFREEGEKGTFSADATENAPQKVDILQGEGEKGVCSTNAIAKVHQQRDTVQEKGETASEKWAMLQGRGEKVFATNRSQKKDSSDGIEVGAKVLVANDDEQCRASSSSDEALILAHRDQNQGCQDETQEQIVVLSCKEVFFCL